MNSTKNNILADTLKRAVLKAFQKQKEGIFTTPEEISQYVTEKIIFECEGLVLYIPKLNRQIQERNERIRKEFTGNNIQELAMKYKVSVQWAYHILKKGEK